VALLVTIIGASGQQAISTAVPAARGAQLSAMGVDANGVSLAQQVPAIETSRLRQQSGRPFALGVDENGNAVADVEGSSSDDDSLGAQMILKSEERPPVFVVSGSASVVYTSNVALASEDERPDVFAVAGAGIAWTPRLSPTVQTAVAANASIFRYNRTPELDFQNLSLHAGLGWSPRSLQGVTLFASYDFTELLSSSGRHILADNVFTIGAQKAIAFGRAHGLILAGTASAGISNPVQRRAESDRRVASLPSADLAESGDGVPVPPGSAFLQRIGQGRLQPDPLVERALPVYGLGGTERLLQLRAEPLRSLGV
jgi:hypothetical protein